MALLCGNNQLDLLDVMRALEEIRAEQKVQLTTLEKRLDVIQRGQAHGHKELLKWLGKGQATPLDEDNLADPPPTPNQWAEQET